jgi:hypothetical protein
LISRNPETSGLTVGKELSMNTALALIAVVGGILASLVAYEIIKLDKFVSPGEADAWHDKYGKLVKIVGPAAAVVGFVLLLWR